MRWLWLIVLCPRLAITAILVLVVTLILGVTYIISGRDLSAMIINMTAALSAFIAIIAIIEVLKKKAKTKA